MVPSSPAQTFPELFETVTSGLPDAAAVILHDETLTYGQLNRRANRLARHLITRGVGPDALVAICLPRSLDLLVTILAVSKAGGAYLPLDPAYPPTRLAYMLDDARPVLLVHRKDSGAPDSGVSRLCLDDPDVIAGCAGQSGADLAQTERLSRLQPTHLMYIIYTSGSTGHPKGVAIPHEGLTDLVTTQHERFGVAAGDHVLQWASISFDAAFWDIALALLSGATLIMASNEDLLPGDALHETMRRYQVTHAVLPPVALSTTPADGVLEGGTIMSTGDSCTPTLLRKWASGRRMFNGYGPTETTVGVTIDGPITDTSNVSIGLPWTGGRVYVLDDQLQPVPDGQEGELYLAGSGLARGYLNRPALTATRFVPDPFGPPGTRMYRSGDRGLRLTDGRFRFTGRADNQVKMRGFRIELGELEARLSQYPGVELAVAVVEGQLADAHLVGYVTARPGQRVNAAQVRSLLADLLPDHLVPARVEVLDELPVTSNGKIDRAALCTRRPATPQPVVADGVPESIEDAICGTVAQLLSVPIAGPADNLFDLGGNSMVAARLISILQATFGVRLPVRVVFGAQTLGDLAAAVRGLHPAPAIKEGMS